MSSSPSSASMEFFISSASCPSSTTESCLPHSISTALQSLLQRLSHFSISTDSSCCLAVADSGATDPMFPDKSAFILYKTTSELRCGWRITFTFRSWAASLPLSPLTDSGFLFGMLFMSRALQCLYIASGPTSNSQDAVLLGIMMPVCWCIFLSLCSWLTLCLIALSPTSLSAGPLCCRPSSLYPSEISPSSHTVSRTPALIENDAPFMVDSDPPINQSVPLHAPPPVDLSHIAFQLQSIVVSVLLSLVASPPLAAPPKTPIL